MDTKDILVPVVATVAILALWAIARRAKHFNRGPVGCRPGPPAWVPPVTADSATLLRAVRGELARNLVGRLNWNLPAEQLRKDLRPVVEHLVDTANPLLNRIERQKLIAEVVDGIKLPHS